MIPKSVEYQRLVNLGNFNNVRLRGFFELEEGEAFEDASLKAAQQVREQLDAILAAEKAQEEAERKANEPWQVTPEMVADYPTLREKALRAAELVAEHQNLEGGEEARRRALDLFGVDLEFVTRPDGIAVAQVEGFTLEYQYREFTVVVPVEGQERPRRLSYIQSLEALGKKLASLEGWPGSPAVGTQAMQVDAAVGLDPGYPDGDEDEDEDEDEFGEPDPMF